MKQKLCYVLPYYAVSDASHFSHIHDLLKEVQDIFDIFLIVERGEKPGPELGYTRVLVGNGFSTLAALIRARIGGYREFYIHYSFYSAFFSSLIVRIFGGRVFYWNCGEPWKYKRNFVRESAERLTYKMVTHLVTGTSSIANEYARRYGIPSASIKIMPNWIDRERFRSNLSHEEARATLSVPQETKIVLFAHRLSPRKGSKMIVPIVSAVIRADPNIFFIIAGSGPDKKFLQNEINKKNLDKNVRLVGAVSNQALPDYFATANAFLMPSEEEGFPRVLLESMTMGVPFVASDVGAVKEIIPARMLEYVVTYGEVDTFAKKIRELVNKSDEERRTLVKELKLWVSRYDVSSVAKIFLGLFAGV